MKIEDIQPFLIEGIKFGQKEISDILSRSDDFNVGIEYEFRPTTEQKEQLDGWFKDYGIGFIREITTEHDNMTEVITKKMNVTHAIDHLKKMFKLISDKGIEVPSMAGLHISISTNKYNLDDINMAKFLILMNADYLHKIFPERKHVRSVNKSITSILKSAMDLQGEDFFDIKTSHGIRELEDFINLKIPDKYNTINFNDYATVDMRGRIELRFFGGEKYHLEFKTIETQLLRSLLMLEIAYTDLYHELYLKELHRLISNIKPDKVSSKTEAFKRFFARVMKGNYGDAIWVLNGSELQGISRKAIPPKIKKRLEDGIKNNAVHSYQYALITKEPFKEGEKAIASNPSMALDYAFSVLQGPFKEGEEAILSGNLSRNEVGQYVHMYYSKGLSLDPHMEDVLAQHDPHNYLRYLQGQIRLGKISRDTMVVSENVNMKDLAINLISTVRNSPTRLDTTINEYSSVGIISVHTIGNLFDELIDHLKFADTISIIPNTQIMMDIVNSIIEEFGFNSIRDIPISKTTYDNLIRFMFYMIHMLIDTPTLEEKKSFIKGLFAYLKLSSTGREEDDYQKIVARALNKPHDGDSLVAFVTPVDDGLKKWYGRYTGIDLDDME